MEILRSWFKKVAKKKGSIASKRLVDTLISLALTSGYKSVDAFALCELCSQIGYTIQAQEAPDLPQSVTAIAVKLNNRYVILYRPSNSFISLQISVLHELCHILLHHCFLTQKEIGKSFYTASDEASAERLASLLLSRLIAQQAWWENILPEQISLSSPPASIQRFMELASKNAKERNSGSHNALILSRPLVSIRKLLNPRLFARIKQLFP